MVYYLVKLLISAGLIVIVSETSKRSTSLGAIFASIPLVSILAMVWLQVETGDDGKVADLASDIFWLVLPSLALFLILPPLLRTGWNFWAALGVSAAATIVLYLVELWGLPKLGVNL